MLLKKIDISAVFAGLDYYDKYKLYRELWQKAGNYKILTSFPLHLDIELSGICNLKCEFCFQNNLINQPLGLMEFDLFKKIIDEGLEKGLCAIKLQIRGESFLHPKIFECIAYAKDKGVMDVQITTNGTLLDKDRIQKVLDSGLDAIILSVDGHHGNSFSQKHNSKNYSSVERSIKELLELRAKLDKKRPWVRLQASIPKTDPEAFRETKKYLKEKFPEGDIFVVNRIYNYRNDRDAFPDLYTNYEFNSCNYLMHRLSIFWNGDIAICCVDYNNHLKLGNIESQKIEDVWLSSRMNDFRKLHMDNKRKMMPICKHCGACLSVKSDCIIYDDTMQHVNDYS